MILYVNMAGTSILEFRYFFTEISWQRQGIMWTGKTSQKDNSTYLGCSKTGGDQGLF